MFTPAARDGEKITVPSWSFLLEKGEWAGMFDLGLRPDVENEPKWVGFLFYLSRVHYHSECSTLLYPTILFRCSARQGGVVRDD